SQQAARANFKKNHCLLHYTANTLLIPCFTQIYPQGHRNLKFCERRAIVFATISRVSFRSPLWVTNEIPVAGGELSELSPAFSANCSQ
ncbi:hypothetical protein, partial [Rahnella variigena]|uniref:hypothetical protein n=1 Tax=Rahnella variigena TaxID=574964 RepID=UPI003F6DC5E4